MSDHAPDSLARVTFDTTLDHVRPTVVKRRIVEVTRRSPDTDEACKDASREAPTVAAPRAPEPPEVEEDRPSSIRIQRKREPAIAIHPHEPEHREPSPEPRRAARPVLELPPSIPLTAVARTLDRTPGEVAAALVERGFFDVSAKTSLDRLRGRIVADAFGWDVREVEGPEPEPRRAATPKRARAKAAPPRPATKKKRTARATKPARAAKPARTTPKRTARSRSRA